MKASLIKPVILAAVALCFSTLATGADILPATERMVEAESLLVSIATCFLGMALMGTSGRERFKRISIVMLILGIVVSAWGTFGLMFGFDLWSLYKNW